MVEDAAQVSGIGRRTTQRVGGGHHRVARTLQPGDDTVPARGIGERSVFQHDRRTYGVVGRSVGRGGQGDGGDGQSDGRGDTEQRGFAARTDEAGVAHV